MLLDRLKVGQRINFAFFLILFCTLFIAGLGVWRLQTLASATEKITTDFNDRRVAASIWYENVEKQWIRTLAAVQSANKEFYDGWIKEMAAANSNADGARKLLLDQAESDEEKKLIADVDAARQAYRGPRTELLKKHVEGEDVLLLLNQQVRPLADSYLNSLKILTQYHANKFDLTREESKGLAGQSQWIILSFALGALIIGIFLSLLITRSITNPLKIAVNRAQMVAQGDLSQDLQVTGRDETAVLLASLHDMQIGLSKVVSDVRENAELLDAASQEISQGNNDLSARTEQQASALQEAAASMEQLSSTVKQNAENARQANQLAVTASEVAAKGGNVVSEVVQTMKGIDESSKKISDIIGVIDSIAFQTNILALNAAVEAARAGEQGRGFAVVASEVRSLAGRSAEAAKEIKALISDSVERVGKGSVLVGQAGTTMEQVVQAIERVTQIMGEISAASSEQSSGVSQMGQVIQQMDNTTQQNAALVEESAASSMNLRMQAEKLVHAVAAFQLAPKSKLMQHSIMQSGTIIPVVRREEEMVKENKMSRKLIASRSHHQERNEEQEMVF